MSKTLWATPTANENAGDLKKKAARRAKAKAKWGGVSDNGFGESLAEQAAKTLVHTQGQRRIGRENDENAGGGVMPTSTLK